MSTDNSAKPLPKDFLSFFESGRGEGEEGEAPRVVALPVGLREGWWEQHLVFSAFLTFCCSGSQPEQLWLIRGCVCSTCGCKFIPSCFGQALGRAGRS